MFLIERLISYHWQGCMPFAITVWRRVGHNPIKTMRKGLVVVFWRKGRINMKGHCPLHSGWAAISVIWGNWSISKLMLRDSESSHILTSTALVVLPIFRNQASVPNLYTLFLPSSIGNVSIFNVSMYVHTALFLRIGSIQYIFPPSCFCFLNLNSTLWGPQCGIQGSSSFFFVQLHSIPSCWMIYRKKLIFQSMLALVHVCFSCAWMSSVLLFNQLPIS